MSDNCRSYEKNFQEDNKQNQTNKSHIKIMP